MEIERFSLMSSFFFFFLKMSANIEKINQLIEEAESLEVEPTSEENIARALELRRQLRDIPDPKPVDEKPKLLPFTDPYELLALLKVLIAISLFSSLLHRNDEITKYENHIRTLDTKNANLERMNEWLRRQIRKRPVANQASDPRHSEIRSNEATIGTNTQRIGQLNDSLRDAKGTTSFSDFLLLIFDFPMCIVS